MATDIGDHQKLCFFCDPVDQMKDFSFSPLVVQQDKNKLFEESQKIFASHKVRKRKEADDLNRGESLS